MHILCDDAHIHILMCINYTITNNNIKHCIKDYTSDFNINESKIKGKATYFQ